jgi:NAD(P)-dependent dehydrogenase (short-subunit alcohol dehydrogenase family)
MMSTQSNSGLIAGVSSGLDQVIPDRFAPEGSSLAINHRRRAEQAQNTNELARCGRSLEGGPESLVRADAFRLAFPAEVEVNVALIPVCGRDR